MLVCAFVDEECLFYELLKSKLYFSVAVDQPQWAAFRIITENNKGPLIVTVSLAMSGGAKVKIIKLKENN